MSKAELTFEEFAKMCEDAGIASTPEDMEQDFRVGGVIADLVDELMDEMDRNPAPARIAEGFSILDDAMSGLELSLTDPNPAEMRKAAIKVAALAVRFASDFCHDEKGQN